MFLRCYVNKVVLIINVIIPTKTKYDLWEVQDKSVCLRDAQVLAMHCRCFGYNACGSFVSLFWVAAIHKIFVYDCRYVRLCLCRSIFQRLIFAPPQTQKSASWAFLLMPSMNTINDYSNRKPVSLFKYTTEYVLGKIPRL